LFYSKNGDRGALSDREMEVLTFVAEGFTSKEVAGKLNVSKSTVDFHLENVYKKLKVKNRLQAVRVALREGILDVKTSRI
jgi:DNA-binding NarL/FixJ family response regulator